jgi:DNA invertase Pin-like site-specific DNA recombinase
MRVGYARVSTTKAAQDVSIEGQVQQLEAAGCDRVIAERASAYKGKRSGWDELWVLVAAGGLSEVLVIDQSRLSRSGDDLQFLAACAQQGVTVRALTGGVIEAETYSGFVAAGVLSVMNQAQSKLIGAKVRDGIRRRREAGYLASGRLPFGYCSADGKAAPDPSDWAQARAQFDGLMEAGMNISGWIRSTGTKRTLSGVKHWLNHPMLRGFAHGSWGGVEALITWQEWEQANRLRQARSTMRGRSAASIHLFTGLVRCGACGVNLHNTVDKGTRRLKCCASYCRWYGKGLRVSVARDDVIVALRQAADAMAELHAQAPVEPAEATALRAQVAQLEQLQSSGVPGLNGSIDALRIQLRALAGVPSGPRLELLSAELARPGLLERSTDEQLRALVIEFVDRIIYRGQPDGVEVTVRNGVGDELA